MKTTLVFVALFLMMSLASTAFAVDQNIGNWTLNQGTGFYANDTSGFNHNGTLSIPPPVWSTNLVNGSVNGTSLSFYGANNNTVNVSHATTLNSTTMTLGVWIKLVNTSSDLKYIVSKWDTSSHYRWAMFAQGTTLSFAVGNGVTTQTVSTTISADRWDYYQGRFDGTDLVLFKNTINVDSKPLSGYLGNNTQKLQIGGFDQAAGSALYFNGTLDEIRLYNYFLSEAERSADYQQFQPVPAYPVGGITLPAVYPPLQTVVNFSWHDTVYPSDEIQVAQDSSFNIMVSDQFVTTDYANIGLNAGQTYYWRVKQYNPTTATYGVTSATQTFTINSAPSVPASGASVQGIVYEIINGVQTPISGATIYLSNSSTSMTFITSSNGYFLFQNLAPSSTYSIYATNAPVYNPSSAVFVTTGTASETTTSNILLTRFFSPFVPNYVYEKFIVRDLFDNKFPGVSVSVFEGNGVTPLFTKTTDTMGQATFQLIKDTYYRVEFSGGGLSSTITVYVYGKEEEYPVTVLTGMPLNNVTSTNVQATLSHSPLNATYENLSLVYNDTSLTTTSITFFVINSTTGTEVVMYNTTVASTNVTTLNYSVPNTCTCSYIYGYFTAGGYPTNEARTVNFGGTINTTLSSNINNWIAIILLVILASMFSARNIKLGAVVLPVVASILVIFGWLSVNPIIVASALILGILVYMRKSEIKVAT